MNKCKTCKDELDYDEEILCSDCRSDFDTMDLEDRIEILLK